MKVFWSAITFLLTTDYVANGRVLPPLWALDSRDGPGVDAVDKAEIFARNGTGVQRRQQLWGPVYDANGHPKFEDVVQADADQCFMAAILQLIAGHQPQLIEAVIEYPQAIPALPDYHSTHVNVIFNGNRGNQIPVDYRDGFPSDPTERAKLDIAFDTPSPAWWVGGVEIALAHRLGITLGVADGGGGFPAQIFQAIVPGRVSTYARFDSDGNIRSFYNADQELAAALSRASGQLGRLTFMGTISPAQSPAGSVPEGQDIFTKDTVFPPKFFVYDHTYGIGGFTPSASGNVMEGMVELWNPWGAKKDYQVSQILPYISVIYSQANSRRCARQLDGGSGDEDCPVESAHFISRTSSAPLESASFFSRTTASLESPSFFSRITSSSTSTSTSTPSSTPSSRPPGCVLPPPACLIVPCATGFCPDKPYPKAIPPCILPPPACFLVPCVAGMCPDVDFDGDDDDDDDDDDNNGSQSNSGVTPQPSPSATPTNVPSDSTPTMTTATTDISTLVGSSPSPGATTAEPMPSGVVTAGPQLSATIIDPSSTDTSDATETDSTSDPSESISFTDEASGVIPFETATVEPTADETSFAQESPTPSGSGVIPFETATVKPTADETSFPQESPTETDSTSDSSESISFTDEASGVIPFETATVKPTADETSFAQESPTPSGIVPFKTATVKPTMDETSFAQDTASPTSTATAPTDEDTDEDTDTQDASSRTRESPDLTASATPKQSSGEEGEEGEEITGDTTPASTVPLEDFNTLKFLPTAADTAFLAVDPLTKTLPGTSAPSDPASLHGASEPSGLEGAKPPTVMSATTAPSVSGSAGVESHPSVSPNSSSVWTSAMPSSSGPADDVTASSTGSSASDGDSSASSSETSMSDKATPTRQCRRKMIKRWVSRMQRG